LLGCVAGDRTGPEEKGAVALRLGVLFVLQRHRRASVLILLRRLLRGGQVAAQRRAGAERLRLVGHVAGAVRGRRGQRRRLRAELGRLVAGELLLEGLGLVVDRLLVGLQRRRLGVEPALVVLVVSLLLAEDRLLLLALRIEVVQDGLVGVADLAPGLRGDLLGRQRLQPVL